MEQPEERVWKDSIVRKLLVLVIITWIILAVILALPYIDLEISIALVDPSSEWAEFIADYGEWPGWGMVVIAVIIIFGAQEREGKKNLIILVLMVLITTVLLIYLILKELDDFGSIAGLDWYYYLIPVGGLILGGLLYFVFKKYPATAFKPYYNFAIITLILALINPLIIVQIVKVVWGRQRFRDLAVGYSDFTFWFVPTGLSSFGYLDGSSFPSGHSAMGWVLIPLVLLVYNKNKVVKILVAALTILWGCIVSAGRVVIGAHFTSDVIFSAAIGCVIFILLYKKLYFSSKDG